MSAATETITDAQVLDADEPLGMAVARRETPTLTVTPSVTARDLVARLEVIKEAMQTAMVENVDYGKVPGTDKPTLLKPGAEKLSVLFQLDVQLHNEKEWVGDHLTVTSHATVFHAPSGIRQGYGEGMCSTREKKYAWRQAERICPECHQPNIRKSKQGDGFYCWTKTGGCGTNFRGDDKRITDQKLGRVENPDLPDMWNTVLKMAEKRARVDAVLAVTGASAIFTQDVEDQDDPEPEPAPAPAPRQEQRRQTPQPTADPPQPTEPLVTPPQRGLLHARCGELKLDDDTRHALVHCVTGQPHSDRIPARLLGHDGSEGEPRDGILGILAEAKALKLSPEDLLSALRGAYKQHGGPLDNNTGPLLTSLRDLANSGSLP